jgi:protein O-GlcNAc transferase
LLKVRDTSATRKIRIGYHCAFMSSATIRYMMQKVLLAHDRTRFEIYGYSPETVHPDIARTFDVVRVIGSTYPHYIDKPMSGVPAIPTDDFVAMVRHDEIDVFVELTGFSMGHRFAAMAQRCAPVQVSFLNHTGSSQIPNVDYILADRISAPCSDEPYYSENIYRLPSCFFCFDYRGSHAPPINPEPPLASAGYVTFGCFGYGGKFNDQMIEYWARLLHRVPNSVLQLQNSLFNDGDCRRFISNKFHSLGVQRDRLVLARNVDDRATLLETYNRIDISLDTWPYCGGNTTAESLWMGVPVVTLKGDRFSSRYGASLLTAAGCGDLVAGTPEEYIEIAAGLAADLPRLRLLRQNLRQMSIENGLADSQRFARDLEDAYLEMLSRAAISAAKHASPRSGVSSSPQGETKFAS